MSYCRFSSDNFACELYCYADCRGGYTTHVAAQKVVGEIPKVPSILSCSSEEWLKARSAQMAFLENADHEPIGLPYDGQQFNDPDLPSFLERLNMLKAAGYSFPDYVIETVEQEIRALTLTPAT